MNDLENKLFFEALVETNLMTSKINLPGNPAGVMVRDETEKGIQNNSSNFHKIIRWKNKINHKLTFIFLSPLPLYQAGVAYSVAKKITPRRKKDWALTFGQVFLYKYFIILVLTLPLLFVVKILLLLVTIKFRRQIALF